MKKAYPNCGKIYYHDAKKCTNCGHAFIELPESEVGGGAIKR